MLGLVGDGLTLARNFAPWFGGVAAAAALAGLAGGVYIGHRWSAAEIAHAEKAATEAQGQLAAFRGALATSIADGKAEVARIQAEAAEERRKHDAAIAADLARLPAAVAAIIAPQFAELRRTVDAPEYDCLRRPLPGAFLDGVRRPGGDLRAPGGDGGHPPG